MRAKCIDRLNINVVFESSPFNESPIFIALNVHGTEYRVYGDHNVRIKMQREIISLALLWHICSDFKVEPPQKK